MPQRLRQPVLEVPQAEKVTAVLSCTCPGAELAGRFRPAAMLAPAIRHHHERWDGSAQPDKLQGPARPMMSRIVAVADAFHTLTTDRPYRPRFTVRDVLSPAPDSPRVAEDDQAKIE